MSQISRNTWNIGSPQGQIKHTQQYSRRIAMMKLKVILPIMIFLYTSHPLEAQNEMSKLEMYHYQDLFDPIMERSLIFILYHRIFSVKSGTIQAKLFVDLQLTKIDEILSNKECKDKIDEVVDELQYEMSSRKKINEIIDGQLPHIPCQLETDVFPRRVILKILLIQRSLSDNTMELFKKLMRKAAVEDPSEAGAGTDPSFMTAMLFAGAGVKSEELPPEMIQWFNRFYRLSLAKAKGDNFNLELEEYTKSTSELYRIYTQNPETITELLKLVGNSNIQESLSNFFMDIIDTIK